MGVLKLAPICLFTYDRLQETKQTIEALKNNNLAKQSELFIFSDGPKEDKKSIESVMEVRCFINSVEGFKHTTIIEYETNKGLANSVINGVSQILNKYHSVIVLEDDLVTAPNFLDFMNSSLKFYYQEEKIFSVSGYTLDLPSLKGYSKDYYFGYRASSWGWATWKDQWDVIDWSMSDYDHFKNDKQGVRNLKRGGNDMYRMLKRQMVGKIDSWAIRWCYHQSKHDLLTVFPSISKIINIGFNENATHTKKTKRFKTQLDDSNKFFFDFDESIILDSQLLKEFRSKFSLLSAIKDKLNV